MVVDCSAQLSKYISEKDGDSLKFMQRMIYLIFAEVVYQRELLPREHFTEKRILGCSLHVPNVSKDRCQQLLHNHLKNAADAVTDKKLAQYHLMVHADRNDPSAAAEVFVMDVLYADEEEDEDSMSLSHGLNNVRVRYEGVDVLQKQTKEIFRNLRRGLSTLEPITRNVSFSFYIKYRDGVNRSFHPSGYGQASKMYELPESAEIGDMGELHAKQHACLLKVKSLMLEDGFRLMQVNAATQMTTSQSLSSSEPSQESLENRSEVASSLGVFDDFSELSDSKVQRSLEAQGEAENTLRFESSPSIMNQTMSDTMEEEVDTVERRGRKSTVGKKSAVNTQGTESTMKTISSSVSLVTKKLAAADLLNEENVLSPLDTTVSSIADASSEASEPRPPRRLSQKRKKSLPKVPEESESDETLEENRKDEDLPEKEMEEEEESAGKDGDTEPSDTTVAKKAVEVKRRRSVRGKNAKETPVAVAEKSAPTTRGRKRKSESIASEEKSDTSLRSDESKTRKGGKRKPIVTTPVRRRENQEVDEVLVDATRTPGVMEKTRAIGERDLDGSGPVSCNIEVDAFVGTSLVPFNM